jgi:hypothetical protein
MAQSEHFEVESSTRAHHSSERTQNGNQHRHHRKESLSVNSGKFNGANTFGLFGRHTILSGLHHEYRLEKEAA